MNLCDECGANQATVHVTHIDGETAVVSHLCDDCAKKKGISITLDEPPRARPDGPASAKDADSLACGGCGMPFSEFKTHGSLGCEQCYAAFEKEIDALLKQVHGSAIYKGKPCLKKYPVLTDIKDVHRLRLELSEAVLKEDFERAAALRDAIHALFGAGAFKEQPRSSPR